MAGRHIVPQMDVRIAVPKARLRSMHGPKSYSSARLRCLWGLWKASGPDRDALPNRVGMVALLEVMGSEGPQLDTAMTNGSGLDHVRSGGSTDSERKPELGNNLVGGNPSVADLADRHFEFEE